MDELLHYYEAEAAALDAKRSAPIMSCPGSEYTSCIKFYGKPILPPLMTEQKRDEMRLYKHQAILAETRIRARVRQRMLARVQAVIRDIEERNTPTSSQDWPDPADLPPPDGFGASDSDDYSSDEPLSSQINDVIQQLLEKAEDDAVKHRIEELLEDNDHYQSPRTITKDSGLEATYASDSDTQTGEDEVFETDEEPVDTMDNVTDLSAEEASNAAESSETTTVERIPAPGTDTDTDQRTESAESEDPTDGEEESLEHDESDKENIEQRTVQKTGEDAGPKQFGTRERVDHLVKQLNSVLNIQEPGAVGLSVLSTNSSATTLSSDEMNQTVIARDESISENIEEQELNTCQEEITDESYDADSPPAIRRVPDQTAESPKDSDPLRASLLNKVEFDTPEGTSDEQEACHNKVDQVEQQPSTNQLTVEGISAQSTRKMLSGVVSPGPIHTPDLSTISHISDDSRAEVHEESLISAAIKLGGKVSLTKPSRHIVERNNSKNTSPQTANSSNTSQKTISPPSQSSNKSNNTDPVVTKSSDASHVYTESTELAQYMATSSDTIPSTVTTLPYNREYSGESSNISDARATVTPDKCTPTSASDKQSSSVTPASKESASSRNSEFKKGHIRKSSYTLEAPSPVLVAAHAKKNIQADEKVVVKKSSPQEYAAKEEADSNINTTNGKNFNLTSSMEDLKLKPVHRKLEYKDHKLSGQPDTTTVKNEKTPPKHRVESVHSVELTDQDGKEEHLQRYLNHLSQMPAYHQNHEEEEDYMESQAEEDYSQIQPASMSLPLDPESLAAAQLTQEELYQLQMQYFEAVKQQMVQQQQQQLAQLLAEQERQQMLMQSELLQTQELSQSNHQHNNKAYHQSYEQSSAEVDSSILYEPYERPYSEPTPRVSFAIPGQQPHNLGHGVSPAGVYCNQSFPIMSPNASVLDTSRPGAREGAYRSPAVIYQRPDESYLSGHNTSRSERHGGPLQHSHDLSQHQRNRQQNEHLRNLPHLRHEDLPPLLQRRLEKLTATAKGFLTRKLMKTEKVQQLIKTIRDTAEFALHFQQETPIKKGVYSHQDRTLQERVLNQLTAAMYEIHEIFFELSTRERMAVIQQSRLLDQERAFKLKSHETAQTRRISAATRKAIERKKKAKAAEAIVFGHLRPKSCPPNTSSPKPKNVDLSGPIRRNHQFIMNRALRPIQAHLSPIKADRDASTRATIPIPKKTTTPRKTNSVKRIQNRPRSSSVTRKTNRKLISLPSAKKVTKPLLKPDPSAQPEAAHTATAQPKRITPDRGRTASQPHAPSSAVNLAAVTAKVNSHRPHVLTRPASQPAAGKKTVAQKLVRHISHGKNSPPTHRQIVVGGNRPAS